jgi:hypothetical protein
VEQKDCHRLQSQDADPTWQQCTKLGDPLVYGGMHSQASIVNCIERAKSQGVKVPEQWLNWPCWTYWLPGSYHDYLEELVAIGAWDNEHVSKPLTWVDRIKVCRTLYETNFPQGPPDYESSEVVDTSRKQKSKRTFKKTLQKTWGLATGQAGKWISLVNVQTDVWKIYEQIFDGKKSFWLFCHFCL